MIYSPHMMMHNKEPERGEIGFKSTVKYVLLPGIVPMFRRLAERFGHFLHMFTMIFGAAGLIDKNHPCLRPENIGRYRFTDVIGLAISNLRFSKDNIPQIIIFFSVILSIVMLVTIVVMGFIGLAFNPAEAYAQFFSNPETGTLTAPATQDWAYQFLRRVFGETGIAGIWDGNDKDLGGSVFPMMLRKMLSTYAMAIMVLAVFMLIYILTMSLVESARTGKPFGDKFDSIWAPIRLVTAIGLLVPIGSGYNAAQMITFQVADWGSALATNVWVSGLDSFNNDDLFQAVQPDPNYRFVRAYFLIKLCEAGWNEFSKKALTFTTNDDDKIIARGVPGAVNDKKLLRYRYGTVNDKTFCGEVELPQLTEQERTVYKALPSHGKYISYAGYSIRNMHAVAYARLRCSIQNEVDEIIKRFSDNKQCFMDNISMINKPVALKEWIVDEYWGGLGYDGTRFMAKNTTNPGGDCKASDPINADLRKEFNLAGGELVDNMKSGASHGWASAGSFYLILASNLSGISESVIVRPKATRMPRVMMYQFAIPSNPHTQPVIVTADQAEAMCEKSRYAASCQLYDLLTKADAWFKTAALKDPVLAKQIDFDGSFTLQMSDNSDGKSAGSAQDGNELNDLSNVPGIEPIPDGTVNPLTSLVIMGNTFKNVGMIAYSIGVASSYFSPTLGQIMFTFGSIYFMAGFTLSFVMPFQPFLHFAFGVLEWIMTIFEAIIGMPLWALSFVSREGGWIEGKPMEGIMMLFEMFLRPTILVFSLIGVMIIFSAGVDFFNAAFNLYLKGAGSKISGRGYMVDISFTVMYVFVMYSLGNSCFKLIQKMPDVFLRWYGKGAQGFGGIMEAGVADVNPYMVANYAKDLSDKAMQFGGKVTKGVISGDSEFDGKDNPLKAALGSKERRKYVDKETGEEREGEVKSGGGALGTFQKNNETHFPKK